MDRNQDAPSETAGETVEAPGAIVFAENSLPARNPPTPLGRGTIGGELIFLASTVRLLASMGIEILYNAVWVFLYFFLRGAFRKKMGRVILSGGGVGSCILAAVLVGTGLLGCRGSDQRESHAPMGSFRAELQHFGWSVRTISDQSDSTKSLEDTLEDLQNDPKWKEHLRFDVRHLFTMEDARESLEFDLQTLGGVDPKGQGVLETLQLLGW